MYFVGEERFEKGVKIKIKSKVNVTLVEFGENQQKKPMNFPEAIFVLNQCIESQITSFIIDTNFHSDETDPFKLIEYLVQKDMEVTVITNDINVLLSQNISLLKSQNVNICYILKVDKYVNEISVKKLFEDLDSKELCKKVSVLITYDGTAVNDSAINKIIQETDKINPKQIIVLKMQKAHQNESYISANNVIVELENINNVLFPVETIHVYLNIVGDVAIIKNKRQYLLGNTKKESIRVILSKLDNIY